MGSAPGHLSSSLVIYESRTLKKLPHDDVQWWIFKRTGHYEFDIFLKKLFLKSKNDCHARKVTKICPWFRGRVVLNTFIFYLPWVRRLERGDITKLSFSMINGTFEAVPLPRSSARIRALSSSSHEFPSTVEVQSTSWALCCTTVVINHGLVYLIWQHWIKVLPMNVICSVKSKESEEEEEKVLAPSRP